MKTFYCDVSEQPVLDKKLAQEGSLHLATTIEVKGDYRAGPVPVAVRFLARFTPHRRYWEASAEDPEERYATSYEKSFESLEERAFFQATFYRPIEDKKEPNQAPEPTAPSGRGSS
jgi:hypothetical protein